MDKNEKLLFVNSAEKYIEDHKIYDLFEHLTKQLLIKKPTAPLDFLIDELSNTKFHRIIFVNGAFTSHTNEVSNALATEFNLKNISVKTLIHEEIKKKNLKKTPNSINETIYKSIMGVEANYKGVIVNGYPWRLVIFSMIIWKKTISVNFRNKLCSFRKKA